jgi:hypothetical protein
MKIAIITQKLDPTDYVFGFFYGHIIDLAEVCEQVHVICLECSSNEEYILPGNVHVHSLGKAPGVGKWNYVRRFFSFLFMKRNEYDTVLVHMEPIYVLFGGIFWRLMRKRIVLWYNHVYFDWKLRLAVPLVHEIIGVSHCGVPVHHKRIRLVTYENDLTKLLTHI